MSDPLNPDAPACISAPRASRKMSHNVSLCLTQKTHLRDRQRRALVLILNGNPDTQVAKAIGVTRRTICRWRHEDQGFMTELARRRQAQWDSLPDKLRSLLDPAVDVLADQLKDVYEPTRFRAATTLLRMADVKRMIAVPEDALP